MSAAAPLLLLSFPLALIAAALTDLRRFIIPNWTCLLLAAGFPVAALGSGLEWSALAAHLGVGLAAFAFGFALWAMGLWGAGDGKLLAAAALWFDPGSAMTFLVYTALIGGALGLVALTLSAIQPLAWMIPALARIDFKAYGKFVPYGVSIAIGAIVAAPQSALFIAYLG